MSGFVDHKDILQKRLHSILEKKKYFHQWDTITLYLVSLMVFAMPQRLLMSLLKCQGVRLTHLSIYIFFKLKKLKLQDNFVLVLIQSYLIFGFWSQYDL